MGRSRALAAERDIRLAEARVEGEASERELRAAIATRNQEMRRLLVALMTERTSRSIEGDQAAAHARELAAERDEAESLLAEREQELGELELEAAALRRQRDGVFSSLGGRLAEAAEQKARIEAEHAAEQKESAIARLASSFGRRRHRAHRWAGG